MKAHLFLTCVCLICFVVLNYTSKRPLSFLFTEFSFPYNLLSHLIIKLGVPSRSALVFTEMISTILHVCILYAEHTVRHQITGLVEMFNEGERFWLNFTTIFA